MDEAVSHPHGRARSSYVEDSGLVQPRPAPRFMNTASVAPRMWQPDSDRDAILREIGMEDVQEIQGLHE
jgi:alpha-methylacyl-CoA racemase